MKNKNAGLTLIEVLIALAIIGIALTAIIKSTSQSIRSTEYLQNKTIAMWVAQNVLNEIRTNVLKFTVTTDDMEESTKMLGQTWYWKVAQHTTSNKHIYKIVVKVFPNEKAIEDDDASPLITLEGYRYYEA